MPEAIKPETVKQLREMTGAGIMDCKRALVETDGDMDKAVALLRATGQASAAKKADRDAKDGVIGTYIHAGNRLGAMIEVNCETDFVARNDDFQRLVRNLATHVVGMNPRFVTIDSVPAHIVEEKRTEFRADPKVAGKPAEIQDKILDGQLQKWYQDVVLYEQPFRDTDQTIGQLITEAIARIGENIRVRRFTRYALGEEL